MAALRGAKINPRIEGSSAPCCCSDLSVFTWVSTELPLPHPHPHEVEGDAMQMDTCMRAGQEHQASSDLNLAGVDLLKGMC